MLCVPTGWLDLLKHDLLLQFDQQKIDQQKIGKNPTFWAVWHLQVGDCLVALRDTDTSWWFQPIWTILVQMGIFPKIGVKKYLKPPPDDMFWITLPETIQMLAPEKDAHPKKTCCLKKPSIFRCELLVLEKGGAPHRVTWNPNNTHPSNPWSMDR